MLGVLLWSTLEIILLNFKMLVLKPTSVILLIPIGVATGEESSFPVAPLRGIIRGGVRVPLGKWEGEGRVLKGEGGMLMPEEGR